MRGQGLRFFSRSRPIWPEWRLSSRNWRGSNLDGLTLQVDSRGSQEITPRGGQPGMMKKGVPDRYSGIRMQFIPEYFKSPKEAAKALAQVTAGILEAKTVLQEVPNIAYIMTSFTTPWSSRKANMTMLENLEMQLQYGVQKYSRERARSIRSEATDRRDAAKALVERTEKEGARDSSGKPTGQKSSGLRDLSGGLAQEGGITAAQEIEEVLNLDSSSARARLSAMTENPLRVYRGEHGEITGRVRA